MSTCTSYIGWCTDIIYAFESLFGMYDKSFYSRLIALTTTVVNPYKIHETNLKFELMSTVKNTKSLYGVLVLCFH